MGPLLTGLPCFGAGGARGSLKGAVSGHARPARATAASWARKPRMGLASRHDLVDEPRQEGNRAVLLVDEELRVADQLHEVLHHNRRIRRSRPQKAATGAGPPYR